MIQPLVSIIVPTKNSAATLEACLRSIKHQTYTHIETIVVDNSSTDKTPDIAKKYADKFFTRGPERSAQRNYGVIQSSGEHILIIDSDMELNKEVVRQCMDQFTTDKGLTGLVIPEESFGQGFWAQCKKLERSFYVGVPWMEAARAFQKEAYLTVGGYDEAMVSGEDWDLSQRIGSGGKLGRIDAFIMHNEGHLQLIQTLRKKYYYAQKFAIYTSNNRQSRNVGMQTGLMTRYKLFFSKPDKLFKNPREGIGMLFMKAVEFGFGAMGLLSSKGKHG